MAALEIISGNDVGLASRIWCDPFTIGRHPDCVWVLNEPGVSRFHTQILFDDDGVHFIIEDLNSTNGVYVNGERLVGRRRLKNNDEIRIGLTVFSFSLQRSLTSSFSVA